MENKVIFLGVGGPITPHPSIRLC